MQRVGGWEGGAFHPTLGAPKQCSRPNPNRRQETDFDGIVLNEAAVLSRAVKPVLEQCVPPWPGSGKRLPLEWETQAKDAGLLAATGGILKHCFTGSECRGSRGPLIAREVILQAKVDAQDPLKGLEISAGLLHNEGLRTPAECRLPAGGRRLWGHPSTPGLA